MDTCSKTKATFPSIDFLEEPRERFRESLDDCLYPDGKGMKKGELFRGVLSKQDAANVPENKPKRSEIFALAADDSVNVASVCAAAMAWGGMRVGHWKLLWDTSNGDWLKVAQCIRDGKPNRSEAYERLKTLKKKDQLKGMGPAFFTKLIYFLTPGTGSRW